MKNQNEIYLYCQFCGKKLIKRLPNGNFKFEFGKRADNEIPAVEMIIKGNINLRCIKRSCKEWNEFTLFPPSFKKLN